MAMNFSPSTPVRSIYQHKPKISPKTLLSLQPQDCQIAGCKNVSWGAASNYVKVDVRVRGFAAKPPVVKQLMKKRLVEFRPS